MRTLHLCITFSRNWMNLYLKYGTNWYVKDKSFTEEEFSTNCILLARLLV